MEVGQQEIVEHCPTRQLELEEFRSNILFDSQVNIHVGFESLTGLAHAAWDGAQWRTPLLVGTGRRQFFENSLTIVRRTIYT